MSDDDFLDGWAAENYVAPQDLAWFGWINAAEQACGHSLDGDQSTDGYSMDGAYAAFLEGKTIGQYLATLGACTHV